MDNRKFQAGAAASPPVAPASPSSGYPSNGNPTTGTQATVPGDFWFHQMGEELRNLVLAAGMTPASSDLAQLIQAIQRRTDDRIFTASQTFVIPVFVYRINVEVWGGGGGNGTTGGGGGGGGYASGLFDVAPGASYTVNIGAGGGANANGGASSFVLTATSATLISASGGFAGGTGGGTGGVGSLGVRNLDGQKGSDLDGTASYAIGGDSPMGGCGGVASAGLIPGGGGGALAGGSSFVGARGEIRVRW